MTVTVRQAKTAQEVHFAEVELTVADIILNSSGAEQAVAAAAVVADMVALPNGAVVIGGELVVDVGSNDTGTATVSIGDSSSAARYLGATNIKAAARTALVPTGFKNTEGLPLRLTFANQNGNATTGTFRFRVMYTRTGRADAVN